MLAIWEVLSSLRTLSPFRNASQTENAATAVRTGMDTMSSNKKPTPSQPAAFLDRYQREPATMNGTKAKISARYLIHPHMPLSASAAGAGNFRHQGGGEAFIHASKNSDHARLPNLHQFSPACTAPGPATGQCIPQYFLAHCMQGHTESGHLQTASGAGFHSVLTSESPRSFRPAVVELHLMQRLTGSGLPAPFRRELSEE